MNASFFIQYAGIGLILFVAGLVMLDFALIHLVAKAARMKNRSYKAFFWLSFLFRPTLLMLVVACIPFNKYDPRSPYVDMSADEALPDRFINPHSEDKLASSASNAVIIVGSILIVLGFVISIINIVNAETSMAMYN